jgi:hypothetical protein
MKRPACSLLYRLLCRLTAARRSSACQPTLPARLLRFFHAWVLHAFHRGRLGVSAFFLLSRASAQDGQSGLLCSLTPFARLFTSFLRYPLHTHTCPPPPPRALPASRSLRHPLSRSVRSQGSAATRSPSLVTLVSDHPTLCGLARYRSLRLPLDFGRNPSRFDTLLAPKPSLLALQSAIALSPISHNSRRR